MKTVLGVSVALVCGVLSPTLASAQAYGAPPSGAYDNQGYYYDACRRSTTNRETGGGLAGAGIGAVIGSNIAAHGRRTEGSVLGGLLGAVVGAGIGKSSAACTPGQAPPPPPPPPPPLEPPPPEPLEDELDDDPDQLELDAVVNELTLEANTAALNPLRPAYQPGCSPRCA